MLVDDSDAVLEVSTAWIATVGFLQLGGTAHMVRRRSPGSRSRRFRSVLMDAFMPVLNGLDATRRIKAFCGSPVVILVSVYEGKAMEEEARAAGADAFLPKSCLSDRLLGLISAECSARPRTARLPRSRSERTTSAFSAWRLLFNRVVQWRSGSATFVKDAVRTLFMIPAGPARVDFIHAVRTQPMDRNLPWLPGGASPGPSRAARSEAPPNPPLPPKPATSLPIQNAPCVQRGAINPGVPEGRSTIPLLRREGSRSDWTERLQL